MTKSEELSSAFHPLQSPLSWTGETSAGGEGVIVLPIQTTQPEGW